MGLTTVRMRVRASEESSISEELDFLVDTRIAAASVLLLFIFLLIWIIFLVFNCGTAYSGSILCRPLAKFGVLSVQFLPIGYGALALLFALKKRWDYTLFFAFGALAAWGIRLS